MKRSPFWLPVPLVCAILTLGLDLSLAGPQSSAGKELPRSRPLAVPVPSETFANVTIESGDSPTLTLNQNATEGRPVQRWDILANDSNLVVVDFTHGAAFPFGIFTGAPEDSLNVTSNGNVGIGVPYPNNAARALHIVRGDTPGIRLEQSTSGGFAAQIWDILANESGFGINDETTDTTPLFITRTGDLRLGPSGPFGRVHVNGSGNQLSIFQSNDDNAVQFRLQTNSTNRRFVALNSAGAQQSQLLFGDNGAFDFLGPTAADVRMRFLANGNVGIGTTAPTQKLSVNGSAGKPGGGSWATFSDERLKDIKGEFKAGLDEVMKLQPIRYEYKADNAEGIVSEGEHIGFGAQEVQKIIPEAVSRNADGYLMVDNDPILWTMLNAIKEQNAQMTAQNAQLKEQNQEIAQLKEQLALLQAQVVLQAGNQKLSRKGAAAKANR